MSNDPSEASSREPVLQTPDDHASEPPEESAKSDDGQVNGAAPHGSAGLDAAGGSSPASAADTPAPPRSTATDVRDKLRIGSRRKDDQGAPKSSKPKVAGTDKPILIESAAPHTPVVPPSVREPLSADLERELHQALGTASIDEMMERDIAGGSPEVELESRHQATVMRVDGENIFFSLSGRHEGIANARQFREPPAVGAQLEVVVARFHEEDGLYELAIPGSSIDVTDWSDVVEGAVVEARITGANTGGLECRVNTLRGFIPASQVAMFRVEDFAEYIDQKLPCVVTEANPRRKNLVLSHRAVLEREKEEQRKALLESLAVGEVVEGVVRNIRDFGAFVDLGGADGLIHISQLSWDRVDHPKEVLELGQKVKVRIEKVDPNTGKIGLSLRNLTEHPWNHVEDRFPAGSTVTGTVSRLAKFGAFVKLDAGVEGLIHISEMAHHRIARVGDVLGEGQQVEVKVLSVDSENQRIALSLKATMPEPQVEEVDEPETAESIERRGAAARRHSPLKGGMDRKSGGENFGLKW